jgi:hypothetical protein
MDMLSGLPCPLRNMLNLVPLPCIMRSCLPIHCVTRVKGSQIEPGTVDILEVHVAAECRLMLSPVQQIWVLGLTSVAGKHYQTCFPDRIFRSSMIANNFGSYRPSIRLDDPRIGSCYSMLTFVSAQHHHSIERHEALDPKATPICSNVYVTFQSV